MIRLLLSFMGAVLVALALFTLMVVLITPPERETELPEELVRVGVVRSISESPNEDASPQRLQRPERPTPPAPLKPPQLAAPVAQPAPQLQLQIEVPQLQSTMQLSAAPPQSNLQPAPAAASASTHTASPTASAEAVVAASPPGAVEEAEPKVNIKPDYPQRALRAGIEGEVTLRFTITPEGRVDNLRVTAAEPPGVFEREARRAVRRWRFEPRRENGHAVAREAVKTLYFRMPEGRR